jgi:hypothetical protein
VNVKVYTNQNDMRIDYLIALADDIDVPNGTKKTLTKKVMRKGDVLRQAAKELRQYAETYRPKADASDPDAGRVEPMIDPP